MEELAAVIRSLADDVEHHHVSESDARDRLLTVEDRVGDLALLVPFDVNLVRSKISEALQVMRRVGRPSIDIPVEGIEGYLSYGLKVKDIAELD